MIRKVAMCVTPWCAEFPDQEAQRVKAPSFKQQATLDNGSGIM